MATARRAALVVTLPLLLRRRWPLPVLAVVAVVATVTSTHVEAPWVQVGAVLVASFSAGSESGDRTRAALVVLLVASLMAIGFLAQDVDLAQSVLLPFVVVVPSWLLGDIVRTRRLDDLALADDAARAARDQEQRVLAAVTEERRRMARELHDVVAHGVSVMLIQAGAARQVVRTSPDQAEEALLDGRGDGSRGDGGAPPAARGPERRRRGDRPGAAARAEPARRAGGTGARSGSAGRARRSTATPRSLPASLDTTIYRIVQEALTNALRYARRAATLVRVTFDDGPGAGGDPRRRAVRDRRRERGLRARVGRDAPAGGAGRRATRSRSAARWRVRRPGVAAPRARRDAHRVRG